MKLVVLLLVAVLLGAVAQPDTSCIKPLYPRVMPKRCLIQLPRLYGDCTTGELDLMMVAEVIHNAEDCDDMTHLNEIRLEIRNEIGAALLFQQSWRSEQNTRAQICKVLRDRYEYIQDKVRKFFEVPMRPKRIYCSFDSTHN